MESPPVFAAFSEEIPRLAARQPCSPHQRRHGDGLGPAKPLAAPLRWGIRRWRFGVLLSGLRVDRSEPLGVPRLLASM